MEIYGVNVRIHSEYRKIRTRKNSLCGHFSQELLVEIDAFVGPLLRLGYVESEKVCSPSFFSSNIFVPAPISL